ncbi:Polysaccharide deacetylase [Chryseobacterium sp. MOF25P]|uniref:polysaccharide deacetylase family protein n=1 Tax=unclassified Chryseobacterium TaxID=2593645 RepID=UPI0008055ECE|nr:MULTISPECIES: polysaccharide deacetylase family protein [unclassified Chryseobacterium]OBW40712.1 Polysaccharide deacetylase [Chryseobacterium sp. MOF25P]OBW45521.1 Polysaccharide deacetylase [Chryseobacterium sp. BGARF1]
MKKTVSFFTIIVLMIFNQIQAQNKCYIYLTFDDGPLNGSENINDIILKEKVKISVFMVGEHVIKNKQMDTYAKYYEENPYIDEYNHSFTHANNHYEAFYNDVQKSVNDIVYNQSLLKLPYKIVRLPGRNMWRLNGKSKNDVSNGIQTADQLVKLGYKVVGWDVEWQHHENDGTPIQSVDEMYKWVQNLCNSGNTFTKNNVVMLIHDEMFQKSWEESELKQLIILLRSNPNYVFEQMRFYPQ